MPVILSQMLEAYRWIGALLVLSAIHQCLSQPSRHHDRAHSAGLRLVVRGQLRAGASGVLGFFRHVGYLVGGSVLNSIGKGKDFLRDM